MAVKRQLRQQPMKQQLSGAERARARGASAEAEPTPEATETPTAEPEPEATAEAAATEAMTPETETAVPPADMMVTITVESGRTVVRSEPSATGRVIGVVADGTVWPMLETSEDGEWIRIGYGADSGWVLAEYTETNE